MLPSPGLVAWEIQLPRVRFIRLRTYVTPPGDEPVHVVVHVQRVGTRDVLLDTELTEAELIEVDLSAYASERIRLVLASDAPGGEEVEWVWPRLRMPAR